MSDTTPTEEGDRSLSLGGPVDAACDRYEADWKAGRRPLIEDYLGGVPESGQTALFHEPLELELTYRRRVGERLMQEEYQRRFPQHVAVIETILGAAPPPRTASHHSVSDCLAVIEAILGAASPARIARPRSGADDSLVFGLLALQNNFVGRDTLVAAFAAWVTDESRDLGRILLESGAVDAETHAVLDARA
jgi:hypothetical protein